MTIDGTDHSISKLMRKGKLVLTHRQGAFGLSIVALDYINGGNYSYLYNLEGFDSQWNDNRHNNRLLFANLPPGNYSLNVRYRNNMTGELSPVGRLAIRVLPPPYASAWAWVVYGTAACVFVAFTGRYLERRRRERMHRRQALYDQHSKELLYESRIRSFASLTNELSVPLTLINGSCQQILECGASDGFVLRQVGFIHRNALKLKDLTCLLNELRAAGAADRPDDVELLDVTRMCNGLVQTFAEYAETHKVGYRTEVGEGMLFPSARGTLSMVLNIVLSNAFRRSETGGEVFFGVSVVQDRLRVVVSNRGEGVDLGQIEFLSDRYRLLDYLESRGKGGLSQKGDMELAICHNLAAKLGGEFRIASEGDVTTVTLSFPELEIARVTQPVLQVDMASDRQFGMPGAPAVSAVTSAMRCRRCSWCAKTPTWLRSSRNSSPAPMTLRSWEARAGCGATGSVAATGRHLQCGDARSGHDRCDPAYPQEQAHGTGAGHPADVGLAFRDEDRGTGVGGGHLPGLPLRHRAPEKRRGAVAAPL